MDDRTSQIREGAGLDESRINQDFIDMLRKWSSPALMVIAGIVLLFAGKNFLDKRANERVNRAFEEVANAVDYTVASPSPVTLRAIREQYGDVRGIAPMSALREADVYLNAAVRGVAPGAEPELDADNQPTGTFAAEDLLDEAGRAEMLEKAGALYREVAGMTKGGEDWAIHRLGAQFGLAAVAESTGDAAGAKSAYAEAKAIAEAAGFALWAKVADERMATAESMVVPVTLISREALPKAPEVDLELPAMPGLGEMPGAEAPVATEAPAQETGGAAVPPEAEETEETPVPPSEVESDRDE